MSTAQNFRITAMVVASALFMQNFDSTVVATALPSMARGLHVNPIHLSSAITAYVVALTVFIPISGWVADRFGAKRVFMAAIAVFTTASALCALSDGLAELIAARVLQGAGGAMMVPVGRLLLLRRVRREDLLSATTWLTMPALIGPLLGPPVGGFITDAISWQAVFWINIPVGAVGMLLIQRFIAPIEATRPPPPDIVGMVLVGATLAALMAGLETAGRGIVTPLGTAAMILAGLLLGFLAIRHCRRTENPAVDFSLLSITTFRATTVAGSMFRAGAGAIPFLVPLTLQLGFGVSASRSGMVTLAGTLGSLCMRSMTRFALRWFSVRTVLLISSTGLASTMCVSAAFNPAWPLTAVFAVLLIGGLTRSLGFSSMGALTYADIPQAKLSAATSLSGAAQQLPRAVGVAVTAGTMQVTMLLAGRDAPIGFDFTAAFIAGALLILASVPMFAALPADAGAGITKGQRQRGHAPVEAPEAEPAGSNISR